MAALLCCILASSVCTACKPTDFFTEIVISPDATTVDKDNPNRPVVNSRTAKKESSELSALDFSDDAKQSDTVENLLVYKSKKATEKDDATVHSLFSGNPNLTGVESSDPVELKYNSKDTVDKKVEIDSDTIRKDANSAKGTKGSKTKKGSKSSNGSNAGTSKGDSGKNGNGESADKGKAKTDDKGYDGSDITFDPSGALDDPQKADSVGAIGQAAVLVQSLGGKGALCAMDAYTYNGKNSQGSDDKTLASSFKEVFSGELSSDFATNAIQWSGDGTSPSCVKDIGELVKAVGKNGVIIYPGHYDDRTSFFNSKQLTKLKAAGIQLVPVDFSSADGILQAAELVGKVLKGSSKTQLDASDMAKKYKKAFKSIMKAAASTHGKTYAAATASGGSVYNYSDGGDVEYLGVYGVIATDFESGVSYVNKSYDIDTTGGVLFTHVGNSGSPLSVYAQAAGVSDRAASTTVVSSKGESDTDLQIVWQLKDARYNLADFSGYSNSGAFSKLSPYRAKNSKSTHGNLLLWYNGGDNEASGGLGSAGMPYLVVSATQNKTAAQVKSAVVASISKKDTTYYAYKYCSSGLLSGYCAEDQEVNGKTVRVGGFVGWQDGVSANYFTDKGGSAENAVVENPIGLLGSWVQGTPESVLESLWLAQIYSAKPDSKSSYEPINDMSKVSVSIDSDTYTTLKETVTGFYKTFYRYTLGSGVAYSDLVTDEGRG